MVISQFQEMNIIGWWVSMAFTLPTDRLERQKVLLEVSRGNIVKFVVDGKTYTITPRIHPSSKFKRV